MSLVYCYAALCCLWQRKGTRGCAWLTEHLVKVQHFIRQLWSPVKPTFHSGSAVPRAPSWYQRVERPEGLDHRWLGTRAWGCQALLPGRAHHRTLVCPAPCAAGPGVPPACSACTPAHCTAGQYQSPLTGAETRGGCFLQGQGFPRALGTPY